MHQRCPEVLLPSLLGESGELKYSEGMDRITRQDYKPYLERIIQSANALITNKSKATITHDTPMTRERAARTMVGDCEGSITIDERPKLMSPQYSFLVNSVEAARHKLAAQADANSPANDGNEGGDKGEQKMGGKTDDERISDIQHADAESVDDGGNIGGEARIQELIDDDEFRGFGSDWFCAPFLFLFFSQGLRRFYIRRSLGVWRWFFGVRRNCKYNAAITGGNTKVVLATRFLLPSNRDGSI